MTEVSTVNVVTAKRWLDENEAILIDVREVAENEMCSIPKAHLLPLGEVSARKLPESAKTKKVIVHCKLGGRSLQACEQLLSEDASLDLYNLEGGIAAWDEAGFEVKK